ncbi:DUF3500 domain-containing protein [Luteimonas aestuarii]|nr:DUF3500 domain-containing protein [Luteimonas aestuarii]
MCNGSRTRHWRVVAVLSGALILGGCAFSAGHGNPENTPRFPALPASTPPADLQTLRIVAAAEDFLATLTARQRAAILFAFDDRAQRARWSNLPEGLFERRGLRWAELTAEQRAALRDVLTNVLSPKGLAVVDAILAADDLLDDSGPIDRFVDRLWGIRRGSDWYYVSFLGEPAADRPWMLQFGGHHLAINATVVGPHVTLAPMLTGAEPVRFVANGRTFDIFGEETAAATLLMDSLSEVQRDRAVVGARRPTDLALGSGRDGTRLPAVGLPASAMHAAQKAVLFALIEARMGLLNADDLAPKLGQVREDLDEIHFAWFGPQPDAGTGYWRITGPRLFIEFSPQTRGGDPSNHVHAIYREFGQDYGAAWLEAE